VGETADAKHRELPSLKGTYAQKGGVKPVSRGYARSPQVEHNKKKNGVGGKLPLRKKRNKKDRKQKVWAGGERKKKNDG